MAYTNEDFELESRKIENSIYSEDDKLTEDDFTPEELVLLSVNELEKEEVNYLPF